MKRRKFIQASLLATAIPATVGGQRLYGTPASVAPGGAQERARFLLPLSRSGLPPETWNGYASVVQVVEKVLGSSAESGIFFKNPTEYFRANGLDASDSTLVDESVTMLTCLSDPSVRVSMQQADWPTVLEYFEAAGLLESRVPGELESKVLAAVEQSRDEIADLMKSRKLVSRENQEAFLLEFLESSGRAPNKDDLAIVTQLLSTGAATPMVCSVVTVCGAAVTVAVAVVVAVVTLAAVSTTAASYTSVYASELSSAAQYATASDSPFTGEIAKLDPVLARNTARAVRMGAIAEAPGLQIHAVKSLIGEEVRAFMSAMRTAGLYEANDEQLELAIQAVSAYSYRAIDL